jgi:hypothetical protein
MFLFFGFILFFLNRWLLYLSLPLVVNTAFYVFTLTLGYILLLVAGLWMSRLLKNNLMDDVFYLENDSFMQETQLIENEYSVNLPTCFFLQKEVEQRLDKYCQSVSCKYCTWHSGFGKVVCNR